MKRNLSGTRPSPAPASPGLPRAHWPLSGHPTPAIADPSRAVEEPGTSANSSDRLAHSFGRLVPPRSSELVTPPIQRAALTEDQIRRISENWADENLELSQAEKDALGAMTNEEFGAAVQQLFLEISLAPGVVLTVEDIESRLSSLLDIAPLTGPAEEPSQPPPERGDSGLVLFNIGGYKVTVQSIKGTLTFPIPPPRGKKTELLPEVSIPIPVFPPISAFLTFGVTGGAEVSLSAQTSWPTDERQDFKFENDLSGQLKGTMGVGMGIDLALAQVQGGAEAALIGQIAGKLKLTTSKERDEWKPLVIDLRLGQGELKAAVVVFVKATAFYVFKKKKEWKLGEKSLAKSKGFEKRFEVEPGGRSTELQDSIKVEQATSLVETSEQEEIEGELKEQMIGEIKGSDKFFRHPYFSEPAAEPGSMTYVYSLDDPCEPLITELEVEYGNYGSGLKQAISDDPKEFVALVQNRWAMSVPRPPIPGDVQD